jgi:4-alpha-glucanotransferase
VRIDHALGLRRLFWIPAGRSGAEGAYVLQPAEELLGILALESRRHGALVVGEDLGTVPPEVAQLLASFGVLSSRVLYFEREGTAFRPAAAYSARALVTANTHDLAPIAGWLEGRDLVLRREAGQLDTQEALAAAQERRAADRAALLALLRAEGLLPAEGPEPEAAAWIEAIHAMLCRTPAPVVGISLDDVAAEREPVNLPGLALDRYPSWQRRMAKPLAALLREIAGGIPGTAERRRRA